MLEKTDTVVEHKGTDVTKDILRKGSEMLSDFIIKNASKKPATTEQYTLDQINRFDDIYKNLFTYLIQVS